MDGHGGNKDETSIKPVSSLLSRFEQLGKDDSRPARSPAAQRSPFLRPSSGDRSAHAERPLSAGDDSLQALHPSTRDHTAPSPPAARTPHSRTPRPQSMIAASPTRPSPPLVTVNSPKSPGGIQHASVDLLTTNTQKSLSSRQPTPSPTRLTARTLNRTPSPAIEARMGALLQDPAPSKALSDGINTGPPTPNLKPRTQTSSVPPPVNRAGKPQVPAKPTKLSKHSEALAAPEALIDSTDHNISPFGTPPSSGANSPRPVNGQSGPAGHRASESSVNTEPRKDSDASFVERLRTNSSASASQRDRGDSEASRVTRTRVDSNASFVEPSSLPDSWHFPSTPPLSQSISSTGPSRAARYRPIGGSSQLAADDQPSDRPRLPVRPELQIRNGRTSPPKPLSGRTSPVKQSSLSGLKKSATIDVTAPTHRIPATRPSQKSALSLGFDRTAPSPQAKLAPAPPAVPAPRRSVDRRRNMPPAASGPVINDGSFDEAANVLEHAQTSPAATSPVTVPSANDYPDSSHASRRPPKFNFRPQQIPTEYDTRTFAVCGEYVCTTGHRTKVWSLRTGDQLLDLEHQEMRVSSLVFKPSPSPEDQGKRIWLGTSIGDIHEVDIPSQRVVKTSTGVHTRRDIIRMFRHVSELWTLDDGGDLNVWKPDSKGVTGLDSHFNTFRVPKGHTFSIALGEHLWIATGKDIRVFRPGAESMADFQVTTTLLSHPNTGGVFSGTTLSEQPDLVYFGHSDGKISIYNRRKLLCVAVVNVSLYKITSLAGVGEYLWAGFNTGMTYVYDTSTTPWTIKKDWQAHEKQVCGIIAESSSVWKLDRLQVVTLGTDNFLRVWDGMLEEDWLDEQMVKHDNEYCSFREVTAAVLTWNAGASKPSYLRQSKDDEDFLRTYMTDREPPDVFVFGLQELVDLEDKKLTAKTFFKSKRKEAGSEQEHMSHQYRAWRDHFTRCLDEYMDGSSNYTLLSTASLVGLFTCVFVKSSLRNRITQVQTAEVKRGMGGHYGNKGALVLRMVIDDSSICFVNCHLAAGQTQTIHRNNDVAAILETESLTPYPLDTTASGGSAQHSDVFVSGGDGSMILDHEICILHGDLNYRIDTMGRDTVIKHITQNNLWRLLERDQLLLSRKKNPGFRLRAFQESEIRFAPTYKYDVHTDDYDTSEKRRAPAWCDRILYRGLGKVKMEEYRRWEVRVSDHRPVSGRLRFRVKSVDGGRRQRVWEAARREFEVVRRRVGMAVQLEYLTDVLGLSYREATEALKA